MICDFDRVSRRIPVRHPIGLMVDEARKELYIASPAQRKSQTEDQEPVLSERWMICIYDYIHICTYILYSILKVRMSLQPQYIYIYMYLHLHVV